MFTVGNHDPADLYSYRPVRDTSPQKRKYVAAHEGNPQVDTNHVSDSNNRSIPLFQALKTSQFWSLFGIFGFCILCLGLIMTHLVPFARDTGISPMRAASLLTTMALCSIAGRLAAGFLSDRVGASRVLFCGLLLQAVMILWLSRMSSLGMFYVFSSLFGIAYGANLVMIPRLTAFIFGVKYMGAIYGSLSVADGIGFAIGPVLAGYLFDISGSYNDAFIITAVGVFMAVSLTFALRNKR